MPGPASQLGFDTSRNGSFARHLGDDADDLGVGGEVGGHRGLGYFDRRPAGQPRRDHIARGIVHVDHLVADLAAVSPRSCPEKCKDAYPLTPPLCGRDLATSRVVRPSAYQWEDLQTYARDGELSIDNNVSERSVRAQAIGRKKRPFCRGDRGGQTAVTLCSLLAHCKRNQSDPFVDRKGIPERLLTHPVDRLGDSPSFPKPRSCKT